MPMKFKPSTYKRVGGIKKGTHTYMSSASNAALQEAAHANLTTPKMKDKIMKELVRRGVI
jgi:hypothetical protein